MTQTRYIRYDDDDTEQGDNIQLERIEIVTSDDAEDPVWIYMLDEAGLRIEGGEFDRQAFMAAVREFYNREF